MGKDKTNPPVSPNTAWGPPLKFARTGTPTSAINTHTLADMVPLFAPSTIPASGTASVYKVIGTPPGKGTDICAITVIIAVKHEI